MARTLRHRGPDDSGAWAEAQSGTVLGHRRLSIIDLSPSGHQPMASHDGRWVITYNGEIYNFQQLRQEVEQKRGQIPWRGTSDTEVMLEAVSCWGVEAAVRRMNGMFALALWDRKERRLYLVRDRLGQKPLYYGWMGHTFLFGSELKALRAHPAFAAQVDRDALALYLRHNYIPSPHCIFKGVAKLMPGTILKLSPVEPGSQPRLHSYWSVQEAAEQGQAGLVQGPEEELSQQVEAVLKDAVGLRMISDVPLGAFLSGGIDSSLIVALMQAQSSRPVKTFSIGFPEKAFDEAPYAREVARHLGTDHTEMYVTWDQALEVIPRLPDMFDEPFSDSSQIPTYLVSQIARSQVTVSLSGDAGDELFCGYDRYRLAQRIWQRAHRLPTVCKSLGASLLTMLSPPAWDKVYHSASRLCPRRLTWKNPGERAHELAHILKAGSPEGFYQGLVSHEKRPTQVALDSREPATALTDSGRWARLADFRQRMMFLDQISYLPDDILVKVDRASMAVSLEARAPFLDYRVAELAWRLPLPAHLENGQGKRLTRRILDKYVPRHLIERPKMGFGVPLESWLRGPLRDWAQALLEPRRLRQEGYLAADIISQRWQEHLSGRRAWHYYLWDVLMFQLWLERTSQPPEPIS
jgi:asparagine synthase (glutamine-hydrolysing)